MNKPFYEVVLRIIAELHREGYTRVYAYHIQPRLNIFRSERQLRRDMASLASEGALIRIGARGGYTLPKVKQAGVKFWGIAPNETPAYNR